MAFLQEQRVFFLGAGAMSEAVIKGLLAAHVLPAQHITVSNRQHPARLHELQQRYGVRICTDKITDCAQADVLIVAVKPFDVLTALREISAHLSSNQLLISLAAGVSTTTLEQCMLHASVPVIRAMPNTSSFVQASATALCAGRWASATHLAIAQELFAAIGISVQVEEEQMNAVTGLSGTGPAYFYYVVEALQEAGQQCGLPAETCRTLLVQTLYGAASMLQETGKGPAELRRQVTSPNGTTMAGIAVLEQADAQHVFLQAVQAATQRALEMGQQVESVSAHPQTDTLATRKTEVLKSGDARGHSPLTGS